MFVLIVLFLVEVGAGIAGYILRDKVTFFFFEFEIKNCSHHFHVVSFKLS